MYRGRWNTHRQHHQPLRQAPWLLRRVQYSLLLPRCAVQGMPSHLHLLGDLVLVKGNPPLMNSGSQRLFLNREQQDPTKFS